MMLYRDTRKPRIEFSNIKYESFGIYVTTKSKKIGFYKMYFNCINDSKTGNEEMNILDFK